MDKCIEITHSKYQTKEWRKAQKWYINGKKNECEIYQKNILRTAIPVDINTTRDRLNLFTYEISNINKLTSQINGYEWSETFDGKLIINNIIHYFNLKFVCDAGGAQTRTLRECYHFINGQLIYETQNKKSKKECYYINLFDGNECYKNLKKFKHLLSKKEFTDVKKYFYVGCSFDFVDSKIYKNILKNTSQEDAEQCDKRD